MLLAADQRAALHQLVSAWRSDAAPNLVKRKIVAAAPPGRYNRCETCSTLFKAFKQTTFVGKILDKPFYLNLRHSQASAKCCYLCHLQVIGDDAATEQSACQTEIAFLALSDRAYRQQADIRLEPYKR
ncbi:hypothetical protein [Bradyrhizobium sp. Gha]|uniref:hypothetical protein n=1 Tax=Bradyrhizobium sp. Gha TaxID=1855318 RepID=UPI001FCCEF89|nr:hypothetical protein [Bradyrhizobium sp. Gha]